MRHFFHLPDDRPFAFAGLWEHWEGTDHSELDTCTIVTTEANDTVRPVHDRMPVILASGDYEPWLDPATSPDALAGLLRPRSAEQIVAVAVGTYVNNPRNEGPQCIEPARDLFF